MATDTERTLAFAGVRESGAEPTLRLLRAEREHLKDQLVTAADRRVAELQGAVQTIDELLRELSRTPKERPQNSYS